MAENWLSALYQMMNPSATQGPPTIAAATPAPAAQLPAGAGAAQPMPTPQQATPSPAVPEGFTPPQHVVPAPVPPPANLPPGSPALQPDTMPAPSTPSQPVPERDPWTKMVYDMLAKADSGQGQQQPGGVKPGGGMPFLPPSGKGGGVDVVELAKMVAGAYTGGASSMGGMSGGSSAMGGSSMGGGSGSSMSGMSGGGGGDSMKMATDMMGGGGGGGGGEGASAPPMVTAPAMTPLALPYQNNATSGPPMLFGTNALVPQSLNVLQTALRNKMGPTYG